MKNITFALSIAVLLAACSSTRPTAQVQDDVYDIPDRTAMVEASRTEAQSQAQDQQQDQSYYDPNEAKSYGQRSYYDMTYNDPYWYNTGRFGFSSGMGMGSMWGASYGMGVNYGIPGYPGGWGSSIYNPYWSNSYMSGYGMSGFSGWDPWGSGGYGYTGYNGFGSQGYGYQGYGYGGFNPYQSSWGACYGCYAPLDYTGSTVVVAHRPSMSGAAYTSGAGVNAPRSMPSYAATRNPVGLMNPYVAPNDYRPDHRTDGARGGWQQSSYGAGTRPAAVTHTIEPVRSRPVMRGWDGGGSRDDGGSRSNGGFGGSRSGGGGGGSFPSTGGGGRHR